MMPQAKGRKAPDRRAPALNNTEYLMESYNMKTTHTRENHGSLLNRNGDGWDSGHGAGQMLLLLPSIVDVEGWSDTMLGRVTLLPSTVDRCSVMLLERLSLLPTDVDEASAVVVVGPMCLPDSIGKDSSPIVLRRLMLLPNTVDWCTDDVLERVMLLPSTVDAVSGKLSPENGTRPTCCWRS